MKQKDITGQKFNRWIAIKFCYKKKLAHYWLFECDCGIKKIVCKDNVIREKSKSCGCFRNDNHPRKTHGMTHTKFYTVWNRIKARCLNRNSERYKDYGGRGIRVCKRWLKFENFKDDMYNSYKEHMKKYGEKDTTIERKNNDGNYFGSNCKWATKEEQANNRRTNHLITFHGKILTLQQWANKIGINESSLYERIYKFNWPLDRALTQLKK